MPGGAALRRDRVAMKAEELALSACPGCLHQPLGGGGVWASFLPL